MSAMLIVLLLWQAPILDRYVAAQKAYAANPRSEERLATLASILYENDRNDRAIKLLEPFVKANPRASRAKLFLALGYAREEKYEQARALAAQVVTALPGDYYAQHILGLSLSGLNDFAAAEARFKKAAAMKPDFADAFFQLGLLYSRNPQTLQAAEDSYLRAIALGYADAEIFRNLGSLKSKLGKYEEAAGYLKQALERNPNYADVYFQLADALRKSGQVEQSAEAMNRFRELNSTSLDRKQRETAAQASYEQGMTLIQKDELDGAYAAFQQAARILPQLDAAFYRLSQIEYLRGDNRQALENIQLALARNPFEPEYYFVLARCLESSDAAGAAQAVSKAISLNDRVGDFHNLLGNLLEKSGDRARALESYRRAVQLEPGNKVFQMNLAAAQSKPPAQ